MDAASSLTITFELRRKWWLIHACRLLYLLFWLDGQSLAGVMGWVVSKGTDYRIAPNGNWRSLA